MKNSTNFALHFEADFADNRLVRTGCEFKSYEKEQKFMQFFIYSKSD